MAADLSRITLLTLDVDGILTDGSLWIGSDGVESKRFSIRDGMGIRMLLDAGLKVAILSGHASPATVHRFQRLGVLDIEVGVAEKLPAFLALLDRHGLEAAQAAVMGDDLMDIPLIRRAGFSATVPEACQEVRMLVDHVTDRRGGAGAVREVAELLLKAQGRFDAILRRYEA
jgi:3-deoxy-D-manno-octulosonate 8-phosphate phosphatase (KDO 8-P phosphatase)